MRIAISGTHRSGKSALIEELSGLLPTYGTVDEPYFSLEEEGYQFADPPSVDDFEEQLQRSIANLREGEADVLFDRCPVDFLGYLLVHDDADAFDIDEWLPRVRDALRKLDLVVFVPVESPDRVPVSASEDKRFRLAVDHRLKEILLDDPFDLGVEVLEVEGDPRARAKQIMHRVRRSA